MARVRPTKKCPSLSRVAKTLVSCELRTVQIVVSSEHQFENL